MDLRTYLEYPLNINMILRKKKSIKKELLNESNLIKGEEFCREAKKKGADIALFPEIWSIGYSRYHWEGSEKYTAEKYPLSFEDLKKTALDQKSEFICHFQIWYVYHFLIHLDLY